MDLGLLKWLKETRFYERIKKKILYRHTCSLCGGKVCVKKKGRVYEFFG